MIHQFGLWKIRTISVLLTGLLLIAAQCGSGPTSTPIVQIDSPPEITGFTLDPPDPVLPNTRISIHVNVEKHGHHIDDYRWYDKSGQGSIVSGNGTSLITYQTPNTLGSYEVRVQLKYNGGQFVEEATIIEVIEPTPSPTPSPEPTTPSPEPTTPSPELTTPSPEPTTPSPEPTTPSPEPTTPSPEPTPLPEAEVVAANGLNLRSGPGTNYNLIGSLRNGDILDVQGRIASNEWIQVTPINPGTSGWVTAARELVQVNIDLNTIPIVETPPPPTPTPVPIPTIPLVTVAPTLIAPGPSETQYRNRVDLVWDWSGMLGPDDYFQVEIRNRYLHLSPVIDESWPPIDVAWVKDKFYRHDYIDEAYDREYTWRIIVVKGKPPKEKQWSTPENRVWEPAPEEQVKQISQPSEMRKLYVEPGTEPVGGDDHKKPTPDRS